MNLFEETVSEFQRKGDEEKTKILMGLSKRIAPSQKKRIQENDESVLQELFLPKWVSWEILFAWATKEVSESTCILCNEKDELGMEFRGKFICANCFIELKHKK